MSEKFPHCTKKGVEVRRLKAVKPDVNLIYLINFISTFFPKIIYYCNMLKHYRKVNKEVGANMNCLYIDVDTSLCIGTENKFRFTLASRRARGIRVIMPISRISESITRRLLIVR